MPLAARGSTVLVSNDYLIVGPQNKSQNKWPCRQSNEVHPPHVVEARHHFIETQLGSPGLCCRMPPRTRAQRTAIEEVELRTTDTETGTGAVEKKLQAEGEKPRAAFIAVGKVFFCYGQC